MAPENEKQKKLSSRTFDREKKRISLRTFDTKVLILRSKKSSYITYVVLLQLRSIKGLQLVRYNTETASQRTRRRRRRRRRRLRSIKGLQLVRYNTVTASQRT